MAVTTDFSALSGPLTVKLRKAAALHLEEAVTHADQHLRPNQKESMRYDSTDHVAAFHQHAQATETLREVAALLEETSAAPAMNANNLQQYVYETAARYFKEAGITVQPAPANFRFPYDGRKGVYTAFHVDPDCIQHHNTDQYFIGPSSRVLVRVIKEDGYNAIWMRVTVKEADGGFDIEIDTFPENAASG